jgi:predicted DNA-binding ribbon-helix-helix protein
MTNDADSRGKIQAPLDSNFKHRSRVPSYGIVLCGHPTSLRLEPEWRQWLREIAAECGCTVKLLIEQIMASKPANCPLASAIRLTVAEYWRNQNGKRYYFGLDRRGTSKACVYVDVEHGRAGRTVHEPATAPVRLAHAHAHAQRKAAAAAAIFVERSNENQVAQMCHLKRARG